MFFYIIRRLIGAVLLLIVMSMVTFLIFFATPTDPARLTCGKNCTPAGIEANRQGLGYDKPLPTQYLDFINGLVHRRTFPNDKELQAARPDLVVHCAAPCLGYTQVKEQQIWTYLKPKIPVTASIVLGGAGHVDHRRRLLGILAALFRGRVAGPRHRRRRAGVLFVPDVLHRASALQLVVFQFGWMTTPTLCRRSDSVSDGLTDLFLPCLTLALVFAAAYVRLTRTYMLETMGEDYLRTARAKGLKERRVVFKHTLARGADARS